VKEMGSALETGQFYPNSRADPVLFVLLETSENIDDMDLPGLDLHNLKGKRKNTLAVKVSGNWRLTFKFKNGDMLEVNYEHYH
jgi:plasmid maintenance system killer protein